MVTDALVQRSADAAASLYERSARLSLDIERQVAGREGPLLYLLANGHQETVQAFLDLAKADPTKPDVIRGLQQRIELYSNIGDWLSNAVAQGQQAFRRLENPEIVEDWVREFSASDEGYAA